MNKLSRLTLLMIATMQAAQMPAVTGDDPGIGLTMKDLPAFIGGIVAGIAAPGSVSTLQGVPAPPPQTKPTPPALGVAGVTPQARPTQQQAGRPAPPAPTKQPSTPEYKMEIEIKQIDGTKIGVPQKVTFNHAPRRNISTTAIGRNVAWRVLVDPAVPGLTCDCQASLDGTKNIPGSPIGTVTIGGRVITLTSTCFA